MDQPLLQRIASGDKAAVQQCIERYTGLVWSLTRRMSLNTADAEDAVQEIFVEIWRNAYRFDPAVASETTFIAMIARRRLIDRKRRAARQKDRAALDEGSAGGVTPTQSVASELGEEAANAARVLQELSSEQQRVLRLSLIQGLSHEKIATATGMPLGTVKTHARRGLLRIRQMLTGGARTPAGGEARS
ncbi:MAG: sigma-70 family RNA polymerase sigma factor [Phycisphaerales bacterium]|nr:sigma-70 family RNA polymerase sigma factor [Planctomycetota bacterium]